MKNTLKKSLSAVIFSLFAISMALPLSASASSKKTIREIKDVTDTYEFAYCGVVDNKGLFDFDELERANEVVLDTAEDLNIYICIELGDTYYGDERVTDYCNDTYDETFGDDTNGVYYYIDLAGNYDAVDHISTSGRPCLIYTDYENDGTDNRVDEIFSSLDYYLPSSGEPIYSDDILNAIVHFCQLLKEYDEKGPKLLSYSYDSADDNYLYIWNDELILSEHKPLFVMLKFLPVGIIVGGIITIISILIITSSYKFKKSYAASSYVSKNKTVFKIKTDDFMREYTTKVKIESSSGGSGGHHGGGGSHGGGGHHGGGSHHR